MEILRLGDPYSTDYVPDQLVENYSSMIWTERFQEPGEFELRSPYIWEAMTQLPEMTFISHVETKVVMMVENHAIETDDDGNQELVITGHSVDSFLKHRHINGPYNKRRKMPKVLKPRGAAMSLIWNAIDNPSGYDVTREDRKPAPLKDKITNVMVTDSTVFETTASDRNWWLEAGPLYPKLQDILLRGDLGLRVVRPPNVNVVKVNFVTAAEDFGAIVRTNITSTNTLLFDIYEGKDRSHTQETYPPIIFNVPQGEILNAQYLFSVQDYKTACEVMSGAGGSDQYRNEEQSLYEGWQRRVMSYDAGEPEIPTDATNAEETAIKDEFRTDAEDDALRALRKTRRVSMVSGDVSTYTPYQYKEHYDLGDIVSLYGENGITQRMIVSEYVRTEDEDGDRGYPGLAKP